MVDPINDRTHDINAEITPQQEAFIDLLIRGEDITDILSELSLTPNQITNFINHNPLFKSSLNSAVYLLEKSIYIKSLVLRSKALDEITKYVQAGNFHAFSLAFGNTQKPPKFRIDDFSPSRLKENSEKRSLDEFEKEIRQKFRRLFGDDNEPPF